MKLSSPSQAPAAGLEWRWRGRGMEQAETETPHLQHPHTLLVHVERSWETSPSPPAFTPHSNPAAVTVGMASKCQLGSDAVIPQPWNGLAQEDA